ncbi:B-cell receptor-associated protein 29/31 [Artemisia annua]|uniref:Endoplasmic reticulum transmembrane protein n=1 Tax=Artemisia annua TaxID=35608 RepID=A0A2U1MD17_ARTAN|nr:B-cell receptor-associated protein 29/31 [Artemisia annua]
MTPLLCILLAIEINVIMLLSFRTPLRSLAMFVLDRFKEGRGPIMSTVSVTLFLVLLSSLYSIFRIQKRSMETGTVNQTDHVLLANHILDASLMGFCLFLGLMIDRLHYYVKRFDYSESVKSFTAKESYVTESD